MASREYFVGVDLGATNIKTVVMDGEGKIFCEANVATESEKGPAAVIRKITSLMNYWTHNGTFARENLCAIGVGAAGVVDVKEGVCKFLPHFPATWRGFPLVKEIQEGVGSQCFLINDVRAITLGEKTFGAGRGVKNFVCIALGTGIGGGIVMDGKLYSGKEGFAGEMGHQTIELHGPKCACGNYGCLEALGSGLNLTSQALRLVKQGARTIMRDLVDNDLNKISPEVVAEAARRGDSVAQEIWEKEAWYLGTGIANLVVILNPEMVIIAGGVAKAADLLLEGIRQTLHQRVHMGPNVDELKIVTGELQDKAGAVGAATWAMLNLSKL